MAASAERTFVDTLYALLNAAAGVGGAGVQVMKGDQAALPDAQCVLIVPRSYEEQPQSLGSGYTEAVEVELWVEYEATEDGPNFDAHSDMAGAVRDVLTADRSLSGEYDILALGKTAYTYRSRGQRIYRRAALSVSAEKEKS